MANFYTDNDDIRFLFRHYKMATLAEIMEGDFSDGKKYDWAPENGDEAVDNYDRILDLIGEISGDFVAPRAEGIDLEGNHLNDDGTVTFNFKTICAEADLNCLEVPAGEFDIAARYYLPSEVIQSGEWELPKIGLVEK